MSDEADNARSLVVIVPARAGSKGLPGKNLRELAGTPLYRRAVDQGLAAGADEVIVTTDIAEILELDHGPRVHVIERPSELCGDEVPMAPVLMHALDHTDIDHAQTVLLQPTSPLRTLADIESCRDVHRTSGCDLVMSVCRADAGVLKYGVADGDRFIPMRSAEHTFANRQTLPPVFRPNGAVYVFDAAWLRRHGSLVTDSIAMYEMDEVRSADIDVLADFERCQELLEMREDVR